MKPRKAADRQVKEQKQKEQEKPQQHVPTQATKLLVMASRANHLGKRDMKIEFNTQIKLPKRIHDLLPLLLMDHYRRRSGKILKSGGPGHWL